MPWQLIGGDTCSESSVGEDSSQSEDEGEGEVAKKKGKASRGKEREDQLAKLLKVESGLAGRSARQPHMPDTRAVLASHNFILT